jgi:antitoxin ParD1/3/4
MNVSLSSELERFVRESVSSGRYRSASEVVRDALRLLQEAERERREREATQKVRMREHQREVLRPLFDSDAHSDTDPNSHTTPRTKGAR